mgnify:CR=1 FL=1
MRGAFIGELYANDPSFIDKDHPESPPTSQGVRSSDNSKWSIMLNSALRNLGNLIANIWQGLLIRLNLRDDPAAGPRYCDLLD